MSANKIRERATPEALFDFDGSLVHLANRNISLQNALKYPMYARIESDRFIQGVASTGVEIGPIVSRRPRIGRTFVTRRTLTDTGLSRWFPAQDDVILAGSIHPGKFRQSEERKAGVVIDHNVDRVVGMIDDKPDKLGKLLLEGLLENDCTNKPLVLGVVPTPQSSQRTDALLTQAEVSGWKVTEQQKNQDEMAGYNLQFGSSGIQLLVKVVQLEPFSYETGVEFGQQLQHYTA